MDKKHIFDPLKQYKNTYKTLHDENTKKLFDELVTESNVNIVDNNDTVKTIDKYEKQKNNVSKQIRNLNTFRIIFVLLIILLPFVSYYLFADMKNNDNNLIRLIFAIIFIVIPVLLIYIVFFKMNPFIKNLKNDENFLHNEIIKHKKIAFEQMAPLNKLFNDKMNIDLFKKTIPLINMDHMFDSKRFDYLVNKFNLGETFDENRSTLFVQSGDINGNPFYIANELVHNLGTKAYHGSKIISYTVYVTVDGKRVAQRRTQTLTATLVKPFPYYKEESYLVYGNEAAPNLIFSRTDSDAEIMTDKQIDKTVRKEERKLERKSRKAIKKSTNYTLLGNTEFEVLFGATNRNNEVEFRLLFTPLAQKQLLDLMKDKTIGYGDNFNYNKYKMINVLYPEHLNKFKLDINSSYYYSYDYEEIKKKFINYNNEFFKVIYFAFAPILAIPLYQQHMPHEYIYKDLYDSNVSFYEHEVVANKFNESEFKHPLSQTRSILKTSVVKSDSTKDVVKVTANSYKVEKRLDFVPKLGADGKTHLVPVAWDEYIKVSKDSTIEIDIVKDNNDDNIKTRIENIVDKIRNNEKLNEKEVYLTSKFIAKVINKNDII